VNYLAEWSAVIQQLGNSPRKEIMAKSTYNVTVPATITGVVEASDDKEAAQKFRELAKAVFGNMLGVVAIAGDPKVIQVAGTKSKASNDDDKPSKKSSKDDEDEEEDDEDEDEEEEEEDDEDEEEEEEDDDEDEEEEEEEEEEEDDKKPSKKSDKAKKSDKKSDKSDDGKKKIKIKLK